ncbi:hypothetical protein U1Q18_026370 [Sarracenia purpurea var. burkii]
MAAQASSLSSANIMLANYEKKITVVDLYRVRSSPTTSLSMGSGNENSTKKAKGDSVDEMLDLKDSGGSVYVRERRGVEKGAAEVAKSPSTP